MRAAWLLVASFFLLTGCGGEPYFLEEYEIADLEIESGTRNYRNVAEPHTALGKPIEGRLSQSFLPVSDDVELVVVFDEIVRIALEQGWELDPVGDDCSVSGAARMPPSHSDRQAVLSIFCQESSTDSQDDVVAVILSPVRGTRNE